MQDRAHLLTEQRLPASMALDAMSTEQAVALMNAQDAAAVAAVGAERANVARAVELVVAALSAGGRLIYVGAGTSGRLGVLDAAECPPTFGTPPEMVVGMIAGGSAALVRSVEGAEDDIAAASREMDQLKVSAKDVIVGIAASGTTPYAQRRPAARRPTRCVGRVWARAGELGVGCVFVLGGAPRGVVWCVCVYFIPVVAGPDNGTGSRRKKAVAESEPLYVPVRC